MARPSHAEVFTLSEVEAMIAVAPCPWWRAFIAIAASSGLRTGEILRLHESDLDERTRSVRITADPNQVVTNRDRLTLRRWMPAFRERTVPIHAPVMRALQELRAERPTDAYVFVPDWKVENLWSRIMSAEVLTCEMLSPRLSEWFQMIQRSARAATARERSQSLSATHWPRRGLRALRTTAIHRLARRLSPRSLADHLGYASVQPVLRFYDYPNMAAGGGT